MNTDNSVSNSNKYLKKLDSIAGIETKGLTAVVDRAAFVFLVLMTLMAPHSIAATQIAGGLGLLFWLAGYFFKPFRGIKTTTLALPILAFFVWTILSSVLSYAPDISIPKIPGNTLFLIFFLAINLLRTRTSVRFLAGALVFSCMINVLWTPLERAMGRGILLGNISTDGPLFRAGLREGDGLFQVNGKRLSGPADIIGEIEKTGKADIQNYRNGHYWVYTVKGNTLLDGKTDFERLGIRSWSKSRSWRSSGFYGHYATYAEVLQLIGSLTFGFLIACIGTLIPSRRKEKGNASPEDDEAPRVIPHPEARRSNMFRISVVLAICLFMISAALLLTITRAAQAGFIVSWFAIILVGGGRKMMIGLLVLSIPVVAGAIIFLQVTRGVGYVDATDSSTTWRLTVYREGLDLWAKSARNATFGVGMDSIKRYAVEWRLFDDGKIQIGHYHSTPMQLLVERGLPALLLWLWMFAAYLWALFRALRTEKFTNWVDRGIVLGAFGGVVGFLFSSLVHYNFGDAEVAMVLYLIMALGMSLMNSNSGRNVPAVTAHPE